MPAPKGHPKWGGRQKGTPNKVNSEIAELIKASGKDPLQVMIELLGDKEPSLRFAAAKELLQYQYPKKKAVEVTGKNGEPLVALPMTPEERQALVAARLKK